MSRIFIQKLKYDWNLFKIDEITSKNYFETYQKNGELQYLHDWVSLIPSNTNINNNIYANEIIYGNLKQKDWSFVDLNDNKHYKVFNIIMISYLTVVFFFNIDNPCFLIQNYGYMDFFYFGRIKKRALIEISLSTSGNYLELPLIENNLNIIYRAGLNIRTSGLKFSKKMLYFGMISNIGHHLWNEISGLFHFLNNKNNIDLIDGIVIGPYDFFNIQKYVTDIYHIKTIKFDVINFPLYLNTYPVFLNSIIIDDICTAPLKYIMNIGIEDNIPSILDNLQIVLDIRTNCRIILNIVEFYVFLIKTLYDNTKSKYKLNIVFTGRFLTNLNDINIDTDTEILNQNKIVSNILSNFKNSNIRFDNLIGKCFNTIINHIHKADLMIVIFGTSAPNLVNWICKTKTIGFVQPSNYNVYYSIQHLVLKNETCLVIPTKCFESVDENNNCVIHLINFYNYFYDIFIKFL